MRARVDSPRGEVVLLDRGGGVLELRVNGVFVMDTAETSTERALARRALAAHPAPRDVLVGGLGLGFTAREVLRDRRVERVTVAELEECVVAWLADGTVAHGPALLADDRLRVCVGDVAEVVASAAPGSADLVLLDTDNGPGYLVHDANADLYRPGFLAQVRRVLRPGGVLVVWSAARAPELLADLRVVFGAAAEVAHDVRLQSRDEQYWLYSAVT